MGMDAFRFEIKRVITPNEIKNIFDIDEEKEGNVKLLEVDERLVSWMDKIGITQDLIHTNSDYDWESFLEQNSQYKGYSFGNFDLTGADKKPWVELIKEDGNTVIVEDGFLFKEVKHLVIEVTRIGYMRKPFRHSEIPDRIEDDTIILSVTNFSDAGEKAYDQMELIDPKQTEQGNVYIFDEEQIKILKKFSSETEEFDKAFLQDWKPNQFVQFSW